MSIAPEITTERLTLRQVEANDAADVFAYTLNPDALRYTTGVTPNSVEDTKRFVDGLLGKSEDAYAWSILFREQPSSVGALLNSQ
jgi:RimJ/RimL family protein N-acetyltransferase